MYTDQTSSGVITLVIVTVAVAADTSTHAGSDLPRYE